MSDELLMLLATCEGVWANCDNCCDNVYVDELQIDDENVIGICNDCLNTVTVTAFDLEHAGKSF